MVECPNCKSEVSDNNLYCGICGTKIEKPKNKVDIKDDIEEKEKELLPIKPHFIQQFGFISILSVISLFLFGCYGLIQVINDDAEEGALLYVVIIFVISLTIIIYKLNQYIKKISEYHKIIKDLKLYNRKKKVHAYVTIVSLTLVILFIIGLSIHRENLVKQKIVDQYNSIGNEWGLQDIKVIITGKDSEFDWYNVIIDSSNFNSLSPHDMVALDNNMKVDNAFVTLYTSNGNKYNINSSTLSIYKNGEEIYDDYYNSESYESALKNGSKTSQSSGTIVDDDEELAACWSLAIKDVKANLKSPDSAKFPFSYADEDVIITSSGDIYIVKSWVDAENSFGAKIRSNFTVKMKKSGTGKNIKFTAESCIIE